MKICVDIDGTICQNIKRGDNYYDALPIVGAVETLKRLKAEGVYIVLHTARGMATYENNEAKVIAMHAEKLVQWLRKFEIPYDELLFAKPHVDFFIDDKGYRFENWADTYTFLKANETKHV